MARSSFISMGRGRIKAFKKQKEKIPELVERLVEEADIILEILDARFVKETRNREIESYVKKQGKKLIYILNKSDLVKKVKKYYLTPVVHVSCTERKGGKLLRDKLKSESSKLKKPKISVGIIGYPNTGKSSLINYLIGKSSAKHSAESGFTKGMQKIKLTSNIYLIDSPGVIPEKEYSTVHRDSIDKHGEIGVRTYDSVKDPEFVIATIMQKHPNVLEKYYEIDAKGDSDILIEKLGEQRNIFKKKGEVDSDKVARLILKDWQTGKIKI